MGKAENIKNYYKKKAFEKREIGRRDNYDASLCKFGAFENKIQLAFHNCFVRHPNFKGYINEFKERIESTFKLGMSWNNYGEWEIDHIMPLGANGLHEVSNLQALWKSDNRKKGCKLDYVVE